MLLRYAVVAAFLLTIPDASAGPLRKRTVTRHHKTTYTMQTPLGPITKSQERTTIRGATSAKAVDALAEVNAARAKRGMPPFAHDPALTQAAQTCAELRAANGITGHLPNDFAALPAGTYAAAAGCGALEPSWGWGTCCTYENYRFAGAAVVTDASGVRFMHLFVR